MTSPVDFISGPRMVSTPGNRVKGRTASLQEMCLGTTSCVSPRSCSRMPIITLVAILAKGIPVALLTNGTVLEALGLTSRTYTRSSLTAYWMFIRPTTFSSRARATVFFRICSSVFALKCIVGSTQALSPLWTPASSMCSMIPPIRVSVPSDKASTSTSMAFSRKRSINMGLPGDTRAAVSM